MRALQTLLTKCKLIFSASKNRIQCFAHIINLCSSHVIAAFTSSSADASYPSNDESADSDDSSESDNGVDSMVTDLWDDFDSNSDYDPDLDIEAAEVYQHISRGSEWSAGLEHEPLRCARTIIRTLRSSDQRRLRFSKFITDGNKHGWFYARDRNGKRILGQTVQVRNVQLLRDVKTRWDSVYLMLQRLRDLREVRFSLT
jgi:hypothetical protein